MTLTAFNCIACHVRDDFGGVSRRAQSAFSDRRKESRRRRSDSAAADAGRAKLQPVWMKKVLFDGESVRPYMFTRMPQFGEPNLRHLPDLFARLDTVESVDFSMPDGESDDEKERERSEKCVTAGRKLLGDKRLDTASPAIISTAKHRRIQGHRLDDDPSSG